MKNEDKTIRWWIPPAWIPTMEIRNWEKNDGRWFGNEQDMIIKVMRKKDGKWKTTHLKFTEERAHYLARSMEELTGATHEVVDC
jgi:hypothetical protein